MATVQIPDSIADRVGDHARAVGVDAEVMMREALVEKLEKIEDIKIAVERLVHPRPTLSLEDAKRNLGLED